MIRVCCIEVDIGEAANVGGPVHQTMKTFDIAIAYIENLKCKSTEWESAKLDIVAALEEALESGYFRSEL
ncbi:MAG TPA: hypothetical protein VNH83_28220 [Bryobacteraceae bacterium]|nr:hypothetical protein [Bryobacteraceae bacterium]